MRYASPAIAVALTLVGGMLVFTALGKNPVEGFKIFFLNPVRDLNAITELLLKATPLMLIAVGLAVGFRANVWNIGAEGQFLMGAVAATGVALGFQQTNSALVLPAMIVAGALGGALWAAIPALLRTRFNANEILTSLMLVYIAQLTVSWLVFGPWKDPAGVKFPQTETVFAAGPLPVPVRRGAAQFRIGHGACRPRRGIRVHAEELRRLQDARRGGVGSGGAIRGLFRRRRDLDRPARRRRRRRASPDC